MFFYFMIACLVIALVYVTTNHLEKNKQKKAQAAVLAEADQRALLEKATAEIREQNRESLRQQYGHMIAAWDASLATGAGEFEAIWALTRELSSGSSSTEFLDKLTQLNLDENQIKASLLSAVECQRALLYARAVSGSAESLGEYYNLARQPNYRNTGITGWAEPASTFDWVLVVAGVKPVDKADLPPDFDRLVSRLWPAAPREIYIEAITPTRAAELVASARNGQVEDAAYLFVRCRADRNLALMVTVDTLSQMFTIAKNAGLLAGITRNP